MYKNKRIIGRNHTFIWVKKKENHRPNKCKRSPCSTLLCMRMLPKKYITEFCNRNLLFIQAWPFNLRTDQQLPPSTYANPLHAPAHEARQKSPTNPLWSPTAKVKCNQCNWLIRCFYWIFSKRIPVLVRLVVCNTYFDFFFKTLRS